MTDTFIDLKNALIYLKILLKFLIEFKDLFFIIITIIRSEQNNAESINTGVAQLVEHWSPKPGVGSSSLSTRA